MEADINPCFYLLNDKPEFQLAQKKMQNTNYYNLLCQEMYIIIWDK